MSKAKHTKATKQHAQTHAHTPHTHTYIYDSDFEWLQQTLSTRYVGLLLPSLPEKKVLKSNENFIRGRMRGLNIFLNQVGGGRCGGQCGCVDARSQIRCQITDVM